MKLTQKYVAAFTVPSGKCEGSIPFILDIAADFKSSATCDFEINVNGAQQDIKCPGEPVALSDTAVGFLNITNAGDCMGDNLGGSVQFIVDDTADFKSAAACDFEINVKLAHLDFKCPAGPAALSATAVTFSNITSAGGYMSDNFQGQKKTVFKYALILTLVTLGPSAAATTLTLSSPRSL